MRSIPIRISDIVFSRGVVPIEDDAGVLLCTVNVILKSFKFENLFAATDWPLNKWSTLFIEYGTLFLKC